MGNPSVQQDMQHRIQGRDEGMTPEEVIAYGKLKWFCKKLARKLAPPLLLEVQSSLRSEAEPFTPRRATRSAKRAPDVKSKATQTENVLMRALSLVPGDLEGNEDTIAELAEIFDSPLREQHVRVITALFGKEVPPAPEMSSSGVEVLSAA